MGGDPTPVRDTRAMVAGMEPRRRPGDYVFVTVTDGDVPPEALMGFREDEGLTLVLARDEADARSLGYDLVMACITLTVHSALDGVGLTAAVSSALAAAGIPCNVVAAYHHDHVFVPVDQADDALAVLIALAASA